MAKRKLTATEKLRAMKLELCNVREQFEADFGTGKMLDQVDAEIARIVKSLRTELN